METDWEQLTVEHCPNIECSGMLLTSIYLHEKKCSDCQKYFMEFTDYIECPEPISHLTRSTEEKDE